ncbi:MAG: NADH-quinone oxidoreductase subunit NuoE [Acidobacteria bacterium]|nr:MAG: NADH-quinone oxidoreductase subunit NuoE [Acidobacteriota bacterium]MCE7956673.1 NADH-quinone oxidoreductase subunit NuoE [Acidobacteria bacterium ACB2]
MSGGAGIPAAEQAGHPPVGEHGALSCGKALEFSPATKKRFDALLTRYPTKQAALLPALWLAQEEWGWISREAVDHVAALLGLSPAFVWGVTTFYTMYNRAPVGKHLIQFCTSISCHLAGAEEVYHECRRRLGGLRPGETSADGRFTVVEVECLAQCDKAPAVMVNGDDHFCVTKDRLEEFLGGLE